jgi:chromosome segregation ATPase
MKTIEELEALLEAVTRERDKLSVLAELSDGYRRERDEARAEADMLQDRLSESRAEVERLTDERDELLVRVEDQGAELRATREAYTDVRKLADALRTSGITTDDCRAVETIYAVAGHVGSHRIVEAMRYLAAWLKDAKP